jgi:hypothetical protein
MKSWWRKTPVEFWIDLFTREKTRWIAVLLFLLATLVANWIVIRAALDGEVYRVGTTVEARHEPLRFSYWLTWNVAGAVLLDLILLGAVIFAWRGARRGRGSTRSASGLAPGRDSS